MKNTIIVRAFALCLLSSLSLRADDPAPAASPAPAPAPDATPAPAAPAPAASPAPAPAADATPAPAPSAAQAEDDKIPPAMKALADSLKWQTGTITIKGGLAKINLTDKFRYLDHENTEKVLHDIWGNPSDPDTLGMIFPTDVGPLDKNGWGVVISYDERGYVKDDDAETIDYPKLLKQMQQETLDSNEERKKEGADPLELVGWAAPPRYDKATHKFYWAKEFKVPGQAADAENSLNYEIRVLGRHGVLDLTAVAGMNDFPSIEKKMPDVISMVDFQSGNAYADFDPKIDKIAEGGLVALVAGGALAAAAKLGLLGAAWKFIVVAVLALKKLVIVVILAIVAGIKKLKDKFTNR